MGKHIDNYNYEVFRYQKTNPKPSDIDNFVNNEPSFIKWTDRLKDALTTGQTLEFSTEFFRLACYRPFTKKFMYFENLLIQRRYQQHRFFPPIQSIPDNKVICVTNHSQVPFVVQMVENTAEYAVGGRTTQCFPFYVYDEDGSNRRENITDWALAQFRSQYGDESISKWDIFYYVYGLLHHPDYRERYADNLKRELPRIPFVPKAVENPSPQVERDLKSGGFWIFSQAGKQLAEIHLNYETHKPYPLEWVETEDMQTDWRVEKMRPRKKRDAENGNYKVYDTLKYNEFLTLTGIPEKAFAYRLGNRSALDWIVDQYRVKTDKRSGIVSDPNGYSDDPHYIVNLVEKVIQVSVETVDIVEQLAQLPFREAE
ncbi:MAG: type ISP restriction/modification enzyme [Chloroflexota bacterium]